MSRSAVPNRMDQISFLVQQSRDYIEQPADNLSIYDLLDDNKSCQTILREINGSMNYLITKKRLDLLNPEAGA